MELHVHFPQKAVDVLNPPSRYKVLYGGRGSAKSWSVARKLLVRARYEKLRILCAREIQASIKDSVKKLLEDQIKAIQSENPDSFFAHGFIVQESIIRTVSGSEFIFKGLRNNSDEIKSTEGIDICWIEEAEVVSAQSWQVLTPTIRKDNSEIWVTFNPKDEKSSTYEMFVEKDGKPNHPDNCLIALMNYWDNPWFPEVLRAEMEYCKRVDYETYLHVWEGKPEKYGEALIFRGKFIIESFDTPKEVSRFYFGEDFGFASDPLSFHRYFIVGKKLYIDYEFYGTGIELEDIPRGMDTVPESRKWKIKADSARPDTISYIRRQGFNIVGAEKGKGSVEDGISFLKSFEQIIIHPRCTGAKRDFENYKWKTDKNTGEILPIPIDLHNHTIDDARYALEDLMKQKKSMFDVL